MIVHLAVNDEFGHDARACTAIIVCHEGDSESMLCMDSVDVINGVPFRWLYPGRSRGSEMFMLADRRFRFRARKRFVGNVMWDAVQMVEADARELARFALERGFFATEWVDGWEKP